MKVLSKSLYSDENNIVDKTKLINGQYVLDISLPEANMGRTDKYLLSMKDDRHTETNVLFMKCNSEYKVVFNEMACKINVGTMQLAVTDKHDRIVESFIINPTGETFDIQLLNGDGSSNYCKLEDGILVTDYITFADSAEKL